MVGQSVRQQWSSGVQTDRQSINSICLQNKFSLFSLHIQFKPLNAQVGVFKEILAILKIKGACLVCIRCCCTAGQDVFFFFSPRFFIILKVSKWNKSSRCVVLRFCSLSCEHNRMEEIALVRPFSWSQSTRLVISEFRIFPTNFDIRHNYENSL